MYYSIPSIKPIPLCKAIYLTETVGTHWHDGHTDEDVDAGDNDTEDVCVTVERDTDGDHQGEGVEEPIDDGDVVHLGHGEGAQGQVQHHYGPAQPPGHPQGGRRGGPLLGPLPWPGVWPPGAAGHLVVEGLQVAAQEPAHQADVEQEDWQPDTSDADGEQLAHSRPGALVGVACNMETILELYISKQFIFVLVKTNCSFQGSYKDSLSDSPESLG